MKRRTVLLGSAAGAVYSFVGGWALPPYYAETRSGAIIELRRCGLAPYLTPDSTIDGLIDLHPLYKPVGEAHDSGIPLLERAGFRSLGDLIKTIRTGEGQAWYDERGIVVETTVRPGDPGSIIELGEIL